MHFLLLLTLARLLCYIGSPTLVTAAAAIENLDPPKLDDPPALHFTIARRGGTINATAYLRDYVNLPTLSHELEKAEARFNLTKRVVKGNKLVRKAKDVGESDQEGILMGEVAAEGIW